VNVGTTTDRVPHFSRFLREVGFWKFKALAVPDG
jgi:hypothetical protein